MSVYYNNRKDWSFSHYKIRQVLFWIKHVDYVHNSQFIDVI